MKRRLFIARLVRRVCRKVRASVSLNANFDLKHFQNDLLFFIAVCISHATFLNAISNLRLNNSNDTMLCFSSLYWISGSVILLRGTLSGATRLITTEAFSPELQLRCIEKYKVTFTLNAPHQLVLMTKCERFAATNLSSVK